MGSPQTFRTARLSSQTAAVGLHQLPCSNRATKSSVSACQRGRCSISQQQRKLQKPIDRSPETQTNLQNNAVAGEDAGGPPCKRKILRQCCSQAAGQPQLYCEGASAAGGPASGQQCWCTSQQAHTAVCSRCSSCSSISGQAWVSLDYAVQLRL